MSTEEFSPRFAQVDAWPTTDAVGAMLEGQMAAAAAVQSQVEGIAGAAEAAALRLGNPEGRIIYVGAGTSGRLAVLDGVELGPTFDWPSGRVAYLLAGGIDALLSSVEGAEDHAQTGEAAMRDLVPTPNDVVIGVAASGRTPYTIAAVRAAKAEGALTIGIASNPDTPLLEHTEHPILLETGVEVVAGSTRMKAGTAQKIALNLLSTALMMRLGRVYHGRMISMRVSNRKLRARALRMISDLAEVEESIAEAALEQAAGDIKLAVLIALRVPLEVAVHSLKASGGKLREAVSRWTGDDQAARTTNAPTTPF